MIRFYNTLSKKKEEFSPLKQGEVSIYTCGPTVYNYAHIGNLRTYIFEDLIVRTLRRDYKVTHVMNITDVGHLTSDCDTGEDKIELSAKREGGASAWDLAKKYELKFFEDLHSLNCARPSFTPRATEHIKDMIALVKTLEEKGYTYKTSDGVYFDTAKFPRYGELGGKGNLEGLKAGARVEFSGEKRNPSDFALWKFSPKDSKRQMEWESPWGIGFPGWHIECSAMSMAYFGPTLDIHCGGVDHIAIHHTNEIAQSEAANDKPYVRFWIHGEFLVLSAGKMSKSAGTFLTLDALRERGYDPLDYRFLCLGAHYRTQLEFSFESLDSARAALRGLRERVAALKEQSDGIVKDLPALEEAKAKFKTDMDDDINTPKALSVLWEFIKGPAAAADKLEFIKYADGFLALSLLSGEVVKELPAAAVELLAAREAARKDKDFKTSDRLRDELEKLGIIVKDTPKGQQWGWK
ncbi:MAG: cysteine--tRNA ligase [Elusimicrobiota bacterium]|jgi:cysteinyl-tRNA synthetase|nr:cysteine--tRNA ligase [Elusimicrobiota bacterium]